MAKNITITPVAGTKNNEPYYPINDTANNALYNKYEKLSREHPHIIFGGRLAEYKYYDMHQVIGAALAKAKKELHRYE